MPISRRNTYDDYIEPPRRSIRASRETRTSSSRNGGIFGEEVPRTRHVPSSPLPSVSPRRTTFGTTIHIYIGDKASTRSSSRRSTTEERVSSSSRSRTFSRTTEAYTERDSGRIRSEHRKEERVPKSRSSRHQSGGGESFTSTRTYRYAEPEPYRYDAPQGYRYAEPEYNYADPDTYHYAEPEPEFRPRRATCGATSYSRETYSTEERRPEHTSSYSHRTPASSSTPRTSRTPHSYSSSRPSRSSKTSTSSKRSEPIGVKPRTDLYIVLDLPRDATSDEIKKAYRTLSLRWHPDRCTDEDMDMATEKMAEINQANDVLGDSVKRTYYDRYGLLPARV